MMLLYAIHHAMQDTQEMDQFAGVNAQVVHHNVELCVFQMLLNVPEIF